ncbi:MAG: serine/threonine-protein phosphatase [Brevinematales bacterium]|nr:serine/threonine-protein phosphatase [Brevinematales bacterium]
MKTSKYLLLSFLSILFIVLIFLAVYQLMSFVDLLGKRQPPFLVTKQLGIDTIGMFLKQENITTVLPLSYIKEVNGIQVKNDKEFYEALSKIPPQTQEIEIKFSNPFFFIEYEYVSKIKLYEVGYIDFLVSFLFPIVFSLVLFSISYYLGVLIIRNYDILSDNKRRMFISSILLFVTMGMLVISGLDLVTRKVLLPILYITFGTIGIFLSIFFYNLTYSSSRWWVLVITSNILISSLLLTAYLVFFENSKMLLSVVKLNYIIIALNVILGVYYLASLSKKTENVIEKERIRIAIWILVLPVLVLGIVFLIQGISIYTLPVSIFFIVFFVLSPVMATVINDHNVKYSKERTFFSIIIGVVIIVGVFLISNVAVNLPQDSVYIFGIYGIPSILFLSLVVWYSIDNKLHSSMNVFYFDFDTVEKDIKNYFLRKLRKRFSFIDNVKIIFQYPIIYAEEGFESYMPYSEIWDSITDKTIITLNDVFFDSRYSKFERVFSNFGVNYILGFQISNNKCIVGISSRRVLKESDIEQIKVIADSFMVDIQSLSLINSMKFVRVLDFEFNLLRNSQMNILRSGRSYTIDTSVGKVNLMNYWEPMIELAGDIYGVYNSEKYFTYWLSDICGKGLSAAAISFTCYTLISEIVKNNLTISKSAEIVNEILINEPLFSVENFFLTLSGITIDKKTGDAEIVRCGSPPLLMFDGKEVIEISPKGGLIGIFDDFKYETYKLKVSKGMVFLIFSDGLTDIMNPSIEEGVEQIEYLKSIMLSNRDPNSIWDKLMKDIFNNSLSKSIIDDITFSLIYVSD